MKSNRLSTNTSALDFIKSNYLILLIFLLGLALRIYDLAGESIWYDEAVSVVASRLGIGELIKWIIETKDGNPPLYYLILHYWVPVFGDSEFMSRLPSAIFGSLSVFGIYAVGIRLFNKKTGLIAALFIATSYFHIRYAQEARAYTLMVLLSLVSIYCLLRITDSKKRVFGFFYVISSALMMYTHYFGAFIIILQNIFCFTLFIMDGKIGELSTRKWITLQGIMGLLFLPGLLLWAKVSLMIEKTGFWIPEPTLADLIAYLRVYAGTKYLLVIFIIFALLSVVNIGKIRESKGIKNLLIKFGDQSGSTSITNGGVIYLLCLWLFVPIVIPYVISILASPVLIVRYTICASLALYLLSARGVSNVGNIWLVLIIVTAVLLLSLVNVGKYYKSVGRAQWREAISHIEAEAGYGDVILVFPYYEKTSAEHYLSRKDLTLIPVPNKLPRLLNIGGRNIWVVMHSDPRNARRLKLDWHTRYDFISQEHYHFLDVFRVREKGNR